MEHISLENHRQIMSELLHRVKNNFQLILSLVNLQNDFGKDLSRDESSNRLLSRVHAVASIQELVYSYQTSPAFIPSEMQEGRQYMYFPDLLDKNIHFLTGLYGDGLSMEGITVDAVPALLESHDAVAMAIIVNELILNALCHGIPGNNPSSFSLKIICEADDREYRLLLEQKGNSCPVEEGLPAEQRMGTMLIENYAAQIEGKAEYRPLPRGLDILLSFPSRRFVR
ncbi:sensor histidine kinase [Salinispira pacifica]|uniref:histidine kinase n=1 Tax=Salinispira pacifica TaxID=1307761 RepID=V5WI32_9SPIO|nr:sensor histidine kinase [Salinispira pacifica]AHC15487.1 Sensory transduction histidine kinase [Salinispira pacifica]